MDSFRLLRVVQNKTLNGRLNQYLESKGVFIYEESELKVFQGLLGICKLERVKKMRPLFETLLRLKA